MKAIIKTVNTMYSTMQSIKNFSLNSKKMRIRKHREYIAEEVINTRLEVLTLFMLYANQKITKDEFEYKAEVLKDRFKRREFYHNKIQKYIT
jgi:hypothetical protein